MRKDTPETAAWKQTQAYQQITEKRANRVPRIPERRRYDGNDWPAWLIVGMVVLLVVLEGVKKFS